MALKVFWIFKMLIIFSATGIAWGQNDTDVQEQELVDVLVLIENTLASIDISNIASFFIALAVGAGLAIIAIRSTLRQSSNLEMQLAVNHRHANAVESESHSRTRPIIVRDQFQDGSVCHIGKMRNDHRRILSIKLINRGPVHAVFIKRRFAGRKLVEGDRVINSDEPPIDPISDLGPDEYVAYSIMITEEDYAEIINGTQFSLELYIKYDGIYTQFSYFYRLGGHFENGDFVIDYASMD